MFKLWQLISKHPQLLLVTSMHGSHLCNTLYNFHILHVPIYPCNSYFLLIFCPIHCFSTRSLAPLLCFLYLYSKFNLHKTKNGMMGTLCSHHLPLRSLLPKLISLSQKFSKLHTPLCGCQNNSNFPTIFKTFLN
jgi:hypothetical protein